MSNNPNKDISSAGMDKKVDKKFWTLRRMLFIAVSVIFVTFFIYAFAFMDFGSTLNVEKEKLTISTVSEQAFQEFIPVNGTVQPATTMFIAAQQGGVVESIQTETGTMVQEGDIILTLSNSDLRLRVLQRTSGIYNQINQTRNSRLRIKQNLMNLKMNLANAEKEFTLTKAEYERKKTLYENNVLAQKEYLLAKENYQYQQKRFNFLQTQFKQDSTKAQRNLAQIDQSLNRMRQSLAGVKNILDKLVIRAPISGLLTTIELNPGQSISAGERIGQVDKLDNYKVRANIDEYYLSRIREGLEATFEYDGEIYELVIDKVYPVVKEGQFKVDMTFTSEPPEELRRGQSLRIRLQLSDQLTESVVLPRGGFYQSTGGNWVFLVVDGGSRAVRQPVQLGRQNPDYFEVLSGLQPGDKVVTSSYETFGDNEILNLQ